MADYYPVVWRAVAALDHNDHQSRRALYARARVLQVDELKRIRPPIVKDDYERERVALEDAIRRVESEAAVTRARAG